MPLYAGKYAICAFLQNMLRSHDRYKPVSLSKTIHCCTEPSPTPPTSSVRINIWVILETKKQ